VDIILFFHFFWFGNVLWITNMRPYGHWNMYIIYFMHIDLSKSFHLTIGSSLILIQNELWIPIVMHILKFFVLCLGFPKKFIKISVYYTPIILVIHHFFGWKVVKSGSHVVCFHPTPDQHRQKTNTQIPSFSYNTYSNSSLATHTQLFWHPPQVT